MVDSTMVGMKWKPIDNITKKQPPSSTSNSISTSATSSVKNAYPGQSPRLLSNGQSAIIQKQQQSNHKHNNNNSRFRLFSINQFKPHVKKEPIEPALPSITRNASSSSTTTVTNDFDFTGASDKLNKKNDQNNNKKNITQDNTTTPITNNNNNNNDNSNANKIKSKVHIENDNDTDHVETNKLKKKIKKLHNKIDGYKQNEILFRSNTNIITKEILSNQFEISKLHGQLKTLQVNNQNLNSLNNYLINDLITTKIDFQRIRNNLINSLHSNHSTCLVNNRATSITQSKKIDIHDVKDNDNNNDNDKEEEEEEEQQQEADQDKQNFPNTSSQNNDMVVTRANLQKLENNIMMRLNQYEDLQNSLENQIKENNHLSKIKDLTIPMESPYIKKLKETIKTYNNDLKSLHAILNNRTANYQILLNKSEKAFAALEQRRNIDVANMRDYIDKSQKYMQNASIYIAKLEKEKNESNILINDLRNNVTQQETKWQKEVAQLKAKLNNINADNNNTNNINTLKANYETKIKKLMQELQVAQNAQKTKQATIVLLNRELSKVKNELLAAHHYQNPNIPNSDTVSEIINSQKKSYESLLDLAKTEHKREMSALKTQYLVLLNQYKQITAKMHQKFNRDSPIIQLLIKEERQRLLHDVQSYLNIISNNPNMRDQIDRTDVFNAINILNMVTSKLLNPPDNLQFQMNQQTQNNINLLQQNTFNNNNNNNNNSNQHQRKITVKNNVNNNKNNNLNNNGNANNTAFQQTNMVLAIQDKPENNNNSISTNAIKQNASHTPFYTVHQNVNNTNNSNNNIINTEIDNTINYQNVPNNNKTIINNKITSNNISPDISTNTRITTNTHTTTNNQNTVNTLVPSSFTPINKINDITINSTSNNFGVVLPTSTTNTLDNNNPISKNNVNKNNEITTTTTNTTTADTNKHIETIKILNKVEKTTSAEKEESSQTISNSSHNPDEIIAPSSLNSFTKETATVSTINLTKTETPLATKGSTPTPTNQGNTNSISNEQEKNSASMPQVQSRKEVVPSTSTISTDTTATTTTTTTTTPINTIETTLTVNDKADNSTS